jgi:aryl-alcohol dehydrogenase-like predicted oxidoreductase
VAQRGAKNGEAELVWQQRRIGDLQVSPIGVGCAHWSIWPDADYGLGIEAFNAAVDSGVTFFDTATKYTNSAEDNHNEKLIARAIQEHGWQSAVHADQLFVASKAGLSGRGPVNVWDTTPEGIKRACDASLLALGVESIALFEELRKAGKIQNIGVSNFDQRQLDLAMKVSKVAAVQNKFNPQHHPAEQLDLIDFTREQGIAYVPYSPLGGTFPPKPLETVNPRLDELASQLGVSVPVLTLDWHLNLSSNIVPLVGSRRPESITASAKVLTVEIPADVTKEVAEIYK